MTPVSMKQLLEAGMHFGHQVHRWHPELREVEQMEHEGLLAQLPRKEAASMRRRWEKLKEAFSGIQELPKVPQVLFIIDLKKEHIALQEARRLGIVTVGIVDTNCNPDEV